MAAIISVSTSKGK